MNILVTGGARGIGAGSPFSSVSYGKTSGGLKSCLFILARFGCGVKGKNVASKFFKD